MVPTPLKNVTQLRWSFPKHGKIKNVPQHQSDTFYGQQHAVVRTLHTHHSTMNLFRGNTRRIHQRFHRPLWSTHCLLCTSWKCRGYLVWCFMNFMNLLFSIWNVGLHIDVISKKHKYHWHLCYSPWFSPSNSNGWIMGSSQKYCPLVNDTTLHR